MYNRPIRVPAWHRQGAGRHANFYRHPDAPGVHRNSRSQPDGNAGCDGHAPSNTHAAPNGDANADAYAGSF